MEEYSSALASAFDAAEMRAHAIEREPLRTRRIVCASARTLPLDIARRSATITATMMGAGAAAWSVAVWNNLFYDELSAETTKLLLMLGWLLLSFVGMFAAALMVGATSVAMRSVDGVPGWSDSPQTVGLPLFLIHLAISEEGT